MRARDKFDDWCFSEIKEMGKWEDYLVKEALNQATWGRAKALITSRKPDLNGYSTGSAQEAFVGTVRAICDGALEKLYKEQDKGEIK